MLSTPIYLYVTVVLLMSLVQTSCAQTEFNVAQNKPVTAQPATPCNSYCSSGPTDNNCIKISVCNFTCPSGLTGTPSYESPLSNANNPSCIDTSPGDISRAPNEAGLTSFNFSTPCSIQPDLNTDGSYTIGFWIIVRNKGCTSDCNVQVLRVKEIPSGKDVFSVQVSKSDLRVSLFSGSALAISQVDFSTWVHITIQVTGSSMILVKGGALDPSDIRSISDSSLDVKSDKLRLIIGQEMGPDKTDFGYALSDFRFYSSAISGRDIRGLSQGVVDPRIDPQCRCPVTHLIESGVSCSVKRDGTTINRLNNAARYLEYVNDGDQNTLWISTKNVSASNITVDLRGKYRINSVTIKFGNSFPRSVKIEREFGSNLDMWDRQSIAAGSTVDYRYERTSADSKQRSLYESNLAEKIHVTLEGHQRQNPWNFHSISEIEILGRRACYGSPATEVTSSPGKFSCSCQDNTAGDFCDECEATYFHSDGLSCSPCNCNANGAADMNCNQMSGTCTCKKGVTGVKCDRCDQLYHNLTSTGCSPCDCSEAGSSGCQSDGTCTCKANINGARCDTCEENHYGYGNQSGCLPCACHTEGAQSMSCEVYSGNCTCKPDIHVTGRACDTCDLWYWGFPECKLCPTCSTVGTIPRTTCNPTTGKCFCVGDIDIPNCVSNGRSSNQRNIASQTINIDKEAQYYGMTPTKGPVAGGTLVTIRGQLLGEGNDFNVSINDIEQINVRRNHTALVFKTRSASLSSDLKIKVNLMKSNPRYSTAALEQFTFEYKENPTMINISQAVSFASGGIKLTVTGSNLDSVGRSRLLVYNCSCNFTVGREDCEPVNDTTIYCPTPNLTMAASENRKFLLGLQLDGVQDYLRLPEFVQLTVYPDPFVELWKDTLEFKYPFDLVINIKGSNLTQGASLRDYSLMIGDRPCHISRLTSTEIVCAPSGMSIAMRSNSSDTFDVVLKIGFKTVIVGQLQYVPFYKTAQFYGIIVGIALFFIIILVIVIMVWRYRRRNSSYGQRQHRKSRESYTRRNEDQVDNTEDRDETGAAKGRLNVYTGLNRQLPIPPTQDGTLFDRLEGHLQDIVKPAVVDKSHIKSGKICTRKGTLSRIIDGEFTNASPVLPGTRLTIKTFVNNVPENGILPSWVTDALTKAVFLREQQDENILELRGIAFEKKRAYILYPYMTNRSLKEYIINSQIEISAIQLQEFALQIAEGMEYLSDKGLEHRDLAARNCMVDENLLVKISDTSFSDDLFKDEYAYDNEQQAYYPLRWMAIESLTTGYHDTKSDVWSYGVTLWELCTRGTLPYYDLEDKDVVPTLKDNGRLGKPEYILEELDRLMFGCWSEDPSTRPTFTDIIEDIHRMSNLPLARQSNSYINLEDRQEMNLPQKGSQRASSVLGDDSFEPIYGNVPAGVKPRQSIRIL